jgi:hypothetical protein
MAVSLWHCPEGRASQRFLKNDLKVVLLDGLGKAAKAISRKSLFKGTVQKDGSGQN